MALTQKKITVIVPCYNESKAIAKVLKAFPHKKFAHLNWKLDIMVVDNNSTDNTGSVARQHGAEVVHEKKPGKGNALLKGLTSVPDDTDYVVMLDGDNTYYPNEITRMLEPLDSDFCDAILGSRIQGKIHEGAMSQKSRIGNWFFSFLVRYFYKVNVTDVLTGYFAWKKSALDTLIPHLNTTGFDIEMDMITKMARLELEVYSVPISYHPRIGDSKLSHFKDGWDILKVFFSNLNWQPPSENSEPVYADVKIESKSKPTPSFSTKTV